MSEIGWNGRSLQIWKDGKKIAAVREKTATHAREPIDVTTDDSDGDRTLLPAPAMRSIDIQVGGVSTEDNFQMFLSHWNSDEFLDVEVRNPDGSKESAKEGFFLGNIEQTGSYNGAVEFTAQLMSSGPCSISDAPKPPAPPAS